MSDPVRVVVVDDHAMFRRGVRAELEASGAGVIDVLAEAADVDEAVANAARHAGTGRVDVYAEVSPDAVDVFVRDRGRGFDTTQIPDDRRGIAESIRQRMARNGGSAVITSTPGEGTEIMLELKRQ